MNASLAAAVSPPPSRTVPLYANALPLPNTWYFACLSAELSPGQLRTVRIAGAEWILWRGMDGQAHMQSAHCPHLGAHLAHGGKVIGTEIRCPFHGFRFDGTGQCTASGYNTKAPSARLRCLPVSERHGLLFVWWHAMEAPPSWEIPELDMTDWSPFALHTWELRGHPQETTENSVDVGHFGWVHGYTDVQMLEEIQMEGPHLWGRYGFRRPLLTPGGPSVPVSIDIDIWGHGYSQVRVSGLPLDLRFRLVVLATPKETDHISLQIGISVLSLQKTSGAARFLPSPILRPMLVPILLAVYRHEVEQDFAIWKNKTYMHPPALARGDGPVGQYRAWSRQFYSNAPALG